VDPYYLAFALNSVGCYEQSQLFTRGATNNDLGLTRMIKIWFALPPLDEQRTVVEVLRELTSRIDTLTAEADHAVDLLNERRTALISAAVTGQIDVRPSPQKARS
jgi:type I restriction enzyme S subunit